MNFGIRSPLAMPSSSVDADSPDPSRLLQEAKTFETNLKEQVGTNSEPAGKPEIPEASEELRKAFQDFVGQTLFSQMISSMRRTQEGAAYFNGGQAEKIFQGQLDQVLSEELSNASASSISDPMFKLFQLRRQ
jgi:peptidoglycan hydrolase FlgJ